MCVKHPLTNCKQLRKHSGYITTTFTVFTSTFAVKST